MEELIKEYSNILAEEENLLDRLSEKQQVLRKAITDKDWESLVGYINEVNIISDSFQSFDIKRDEIQEELKTEEIKPYLELNISYPINFFFPKASQNFLSIEVLLSSYKI